MAKGKMPGFAKPDKVAKGAGSDQKSMTPKSKGGKKC